MSNILEPGQIIGGRWQINRFLASGGFGQVFAADDISSAAIGSVAVKVLLAGASTAERNSFLDEARHMSSLRHPNLVSHIDSGLLTDGDGAVYLVIDLCEESLADHIGRQPGGVIGEDALKPIIDDISRGLDYLHDSGRVHRDLKPANILRAGDQWKLADFGLVRDLSQSGVYHLDKLVGSPRYMAPEFFEQSMVGPAADVWAVGVIAHEVTTGRGVFSGEGAAYLHAVANTSPSIEPTLRPATAELIGRCLARRPEDRPAASDLPALLASGGSPGYGAAGAGTSAGDDDPTRTVSPLPNTAIAGAAGVAAASDARTGEATAVVPPPTGVPTTPPTDRPLASPEAAGDSSAASPASAPAGRSGRRVWWVAAAAAVAALAVVGGILWSQTDDDVDAVQPAGPETEADTTGDDSSSDDGADAAGGEGDEVDQAADQGSDDNTDAEGQDDAGGVIYDVALNQFSPGTCADVADPASGEFKIDMTVPCDQVHFFEVLAVFEAPQAGQDYPGSDELFAHAITVCPAAFFDQYGMDQAETSLSVLTFTPDQDEWDQQIYTIVCTLSRSDLQPFSGPIGDVEDWRWKPGDSITVVELQPGFCFDTPVPIKTAESFAQRVVVADCGVAHDGERYENALFSVDDDASIDMIEAAGNEACHQGLHAQFGPDHNVADFTSTALVDPVFGSVSTEQSLAICVVLFAEPTKGSLEALYEGR